LLHWRLILGVTFSAVLAGICWLDHAAVPRGMFLGPLAVLLCVLATTEALGLLHAAGARPSRWAAYAGAILPVATSAAIPYLDLIFGVRSAQPTCMVLPALLCGLIFAAVAAIARFDGSSQSAIDFAATVFVSTYIGGTLAALALLRFATSSDGRDSGLILLIATVAIVKAGDIGAYTVGRLIGRRKLAPRLSPGKTWEGALGAILFSCMAAVVVFAVSSEENSLAAGSVLPIVRWLVCGLALSVAGIVGDLAESLLKRAAGIKDSSTWMPGFGGILDMLDSLLLAAPVAVACVAVGVIEV
jgi:phosphatidate cytidylyltransferase